MNTEEAGGAPPINVLVVEDDELVRRMLLRVLERRGFTTFEAADGASALAMVDAVDVDVVLLDNGLPDIAGTEVLATLRESPRSATLPVILVTGQADIEARVGGLQAGADDYLVKPVNMDELVARVHAQIRGRDAWRSQVQNKLHERAQLAAALAAIPRSGDPHESAAKLVSVLDDVPGVDSVDIVEFTIGGSARLLARSDAAATDPADPTDPASVPYRSAPGALAELRRVLAAGTVNLPPELARELAPSSETVIATPILVGGGVAAAVLLGTTSRQGVDVSVSPLEVLSATIDLSPVIERVLGGALDSRHGAETVALRLRDLIESGAFHPVFQPIVDLASGRAMGYEALTRFDDGVPPDQRFAEAALVGMGIELEVATMRAAIESAEQLPGDAYLSINVSGSLLTSGALGEVLATAAERELVLELTEHERIDDYQEVRGAFERMGPELRWSVDDAGSGWASLRHVFALRPHFVKLDRSWVSGIDADRARQALLLGLGRFVQELNGDLVAEGVETADELATLSRLDIRFAQGYHLGRPVPIDQILADLR